jgi:hypothetical protein
MGEREREREREIRERERILGLLMRPCRIM